MNSAAEMPEDLIDAAAKICRGLGIPSTTTNCFPIIEGLKADRRRDQWQPIATAPKSGSFLAYGSYRYPDDKYATEYIRIVEPTGDPVWAWFDGEGNAHISAFTHWQPFPAAPKGGAE